MSNSQAIGAIEAIDQLPNRAEAANRAIEAIASGKSLREAQKVSGISPWALLKRCDNDPELAQQYARARELQAAADASEIDAVIRELLHLARNEPDKLTMPMVNAYRAAADKLQWTAARKHPKVYGDKLDITTEQRNTLVIVNYAQRARVLIPDDSNTLDVQALALTPGEQELSTIPNTTLPQASSPTREKPNLKKGKRGPDKQPRKKRSTEAGGEELGRTAR